MMTMENREKWLQIEETHYNLVVRAVKTHGWVIQPHNFKKVSLPAER